MKNCFLLWFCLCCQAEYKGKITSKTDGIKAEIDAIKAAVQNTTRTTRIK
jgi:hypothetical protein